VRSAAELSSTQPTPPVNRRRLTEEVVIVMALSLLPSAVDAIITLFEAPVSRSIAVAVFPSVELVRQITAILFALAPVALVFYLARWGEEGLEPFGLAVDGMGRNVVRGAGAAVVVAAAGLGVYLAAIALDVNRFVVPVPPLGHWWTVPVLFLGAFQNGLLEETVVVGYFIHRLEQLGIPSLWAVGASALFRASYHLYQGWGGFTGNLLLGLFFGWLFLRWRRVWPLVFAHFAVDALAGLAYIAFRGHCFFHACVR
jgi:membrane protease YdiL (CAAX protease family)